MKDSTDERKLLVAALSGKGAHIDFDSAVKNFPAELRGKQAKGLPHTAWQLLEHLRITQADILDFCQNPGYEELNWPDDYWPKIPAPASDAAWQQSISAFQKDLKAMQQLVADDSRDLFEPFPHGQGQTLFREALLVIDHNSYHLGQLVNVRQALGDWPPH